MLKLAKERCCRDGKFAAEILDSLVEASETVRWSDTRYYCKQFPVAGKLLTRAQR